MSIAKRESPADYRPISCDLHDRLENLANMRRVTGVLFRDERNELQQRNAVITDVFAREKAEYLSLSSGETVRLDRLVEVDRVMFSHS